MLIIVDAVCLLTLIIFNICLLGSYRYDLRRLHDRVQEVEDQGQHLTDYVANFAEHQLDALWLRAREETSQIIHEERNRL